LLQCRDRAACGREKALVNTLNEKRALYYNTHRLKAGSACWWWESNRIVPP